MIIIEHKVKATALDYRGYGVVKDLGKVGFIKGLLPGEEAIIKISFEKKNFFEGTIVKLLTKSKYRTTFTNQLDNIPLIHLANEKQLEFQVDITLETFLRNDIKEFKTNPIIHDDNYFNYRNKALFFAQNKPYLVFGGYIEKTRNFVEIEELILAEDIINQTLKKLKKYYQEERIYYHDLNSILIRSNFKEVMVVFITKTRKVIPDILYKPLMSENSVISIYQNVLDEAHKNVGSENILQLKEKYLVDKIGKHQFNIYPNSFFQVNRNITHLIYEKIKALLTKDDIVIDSFAGMASIGQYISSQVSYIYSIEIDIDSIKSANESIIKNNVNNLEVIKGNFNKELHKYKKRATTIIVDPPRAGLSEEVVNEINNSKIKKIVYLSCNLRTLVRDIKLLSNYSVIEVTPVKMFYQTVEMETIVYLERKK